MSVVVVLEHAGRALLLSYCPPCLFNCGLLFADPHRVRRSMYPLLNKDGLLIPYIIAQVVHVIFAFKPAFNTVSLSTTLSWVCSYLNLLLWARCVNSTRLCAFAGNTCGHALSSCVRIRMAATSFTSRCAHPYICSVQLFAILL